MKTLGEVIEAVRSGEKPDYEDLRYAICAMSALMTFDEQSLMKLAAAEKEGRRPFISTSAQWQWEQHFHRGQLAYAVPPKTYVGWSNDPENPEFLARRRASQRIMNNFLANRHEDRKD